MSGHRATVRPMIGRGLVALLALGAVALAGATGAPGAQRAGTASLSTSEAALLRVVNETRAAKGLQPLHLDESLERAARSHSEDMLSDHYFAHGDLGARLSAFQVHARLAGENLAWGSGRLGVAQAIVAAWLRSPPHRANLLQPDYTRIGIGAVHGTFEGYSDTTLVTADFAG
jgi:uncharacterized protein YkwD